MSDDRIIVAARNLSEIVERLDRSQPLLEEAYSILGPILRCALAGTLAIPGALPNRSFFFGMYEHSLPAHYLANVEFMSALAEFDDAWSQG